VLTAFFLEATFLGVMLFGHGKVSERVHLIATFLVAFGTTMSAFWILSLDSWMQTPAGYQIINGEFHVTSWVEVVFNPSFPYRLTHMLLASSLTVAFLIAGVSAWQVLRGVANVSTAKVLRVGLTLGALLVPVQIMVGDAHGLNTLHHQPQKIAAMEGVWDTERGAPLLLFAWPDEKTRSNHFEVAVPGMASLILTHQLDGEIKGLNEFKGVHPPVAPLFFGFRIMVGMGVLMLASSWLGVWLYCRRAWVAEALPRPLLWGLTAMTFSGWVATVAGWYTTEIGRQPFIVYGLLRTSEVASKTPSAMIGLTLAMYLALYLLLIVAYIGVVKYMAEKPVEADPPAPAVVTPIAGVGAGSPA
jgi:cytochrome d ubiquinol oxidase subunit I